MTVRLELIGAIALAVVALFALRPASAGDYAIATWTVEGGAVSSGGVYALRGVAGQPDAGRLAGDSFAILGGFLSMDEIDIGAGDIIQHLLGRIPLTGFALAVADVNGDGRIDMADAVARLNEP